MNEPIRSYMKPGIVHFMAYPQAQTGEGPISESVWQLARDPFFETVEITHIGSPSVRREVREITQSAHMELCYGAMPVQKQSSLDINDPDENKRQAAVREMLECADEAVELGASAFSFKSGRYDENSLDQRMEALIKSTYEICDHICGRSSMKISLEVFDYDTDTMSLIGPAPMAGKYAEAVRERFGEFGLMVDMGHLPQLRENPKDTVPALAGYTNHIHIGNCLVSDKNSPLYGDKHPRFGYPGSENDTAELVDFLKILIDTGYLVRGGRRNVSAEVRPVGDEDPGLIIAGAKRTLLTAWSLV